MEGRPSYLAMLLRKAYPTTRELLIENNGAKGADVIVLCLHCMMVENGFTPLDMENHKPLSSPYRPPTGWNTFQDEWVVTYVREYSPNRFRLHCAIQARTGRLFVHASEQDVSLDGAIKPSNIQVLGLQLGNYSSFSQEEDGILDDGVAWEECLKNERTLKEMFHEFVLVPLWDNATQEEEEQKNTTTTSAGEERISPPYGNDVTTYSTGILLASLVGISGVALYLYLSSRAKTQH